MNIFDHVCKNCIYALITHESHRLLHLRQKTSCGLTVGAVGRPCPRPRSPRRVMPDQIATGRKSYNCPFRFREFKNQPPPSLKFAKFVKFVVP
ncbi:hypothetical protein HMPREF0645_0139 [Hallella bergensis DSM 17361]|uniref:Uncharacterized protein n=1 Tax=Hallella bergensis DSM 17361 TaxID=585502 RepID=D1PT54_9BACT|nr:hypothetical protein HMPREF0645_0139 [Hallella bergensis DSM 17361]